MSAVEKLVRDVLLGSTVRSIVLYSEDFSHSDWDKWNVTVNPNAALAPDGTMTADEITEVVVPGGNQGHGPYQQTWFPNPKPLLLDHSFYTQSVYAKPLARRYLCLEMWGHNSGWNDWFDVFYDLQTNETKVWYYRRFLYPPYFPQSSDPRIGGLHGYINHSIEDAPNGFKRCSYSFRTELANYWDWSAFAIYLSEGMGEGAFDGGQSVWYVGDDTQPAVLLWGAMMSATPYLTPYLGAGAAPLIDTRAESRVYPILRPQNGPLPAITFQRISTVPTVGIGGESSKDVVRVQIDSWAATMEDARLLAREVRAVMDAANRTGVLKSRPDNGFDDFDDTVNCFRSSKDYMCWQL